MKIKELVTAIEHAVAPKRIQESYDNCGLIVGNPENDITNILTTLDINLKVVEEAIEKQCNVIVAHHPIIFRGLKTLLSTNNNEKIIMFAIQNNISIYAAHTSLDNVFLTGLNKSIADKLGLQNLTPLKMVDNDTTYSLGAGAVGVLPKKEYVIDFIYSIQKKLEISGPINFSKGFNSSLIDTIAICTGTASFMASQAKKMHAHMLITADITYHTFFDEKDIILVDIGHYESEKHAGQVISDNLKKCCHSNVNVFVSNVNTNPVSSIIKND